MPLNKRYIQDLINRYESGQLTDAEVDAFFDMVGNAEVREMLADSFEKNKALDFPVLLGEKKKEMLLQAIMSGRSALAEEQLAAAGESAGSQLAPVHRVHFLKTAWFKYAAAIIILLTGIAIYFFIHTSQSEVEMATIKPSPLPKEDVMPGYDRAVLTLSNGEQVQLNNATSETITDGTLSIKNNNGQLSYSASGSISPAGREDPSEARTATNTMTTPRGGQYKLTLSDGTKVWLNAASSITYPTAFTSKTREVTITGEAYFEVAKNAKQPFIVEAPQEEITVLGTSFNIRSYETNNSKTTLLEGSVRISPAAGDGSRSEQQPANSVILTPNQQATLTNNKFEITKDINPKEILAWKSGNFYFDNQPLKSILEEFSRWYDVEIEYKGKLKNRTFFGIVKRDKPLSHVLELLKDNDIRFEIEGRKLVVQSD